MRIIAVSFQSKDNCVVLRNQGDGEIDVIVNGKRRGVVFCPPKRTENHMEIWAKMIIGRVVDNLSLEPHSRETFERELRAILEYLL